MKPFSIVCKSCASRLKVSKPSAVNQLLGCPKCGTMIRVTPPKGWEPPEPIQNSASFESSSQVDIPAPSGSDPFDFDDIEQILAKPQQPSGTVAKRPKQTEPTDSKQQKQKRRSQPTAASSEVATPTATQEVARPPSRPETDSSDSEPMLPNDDWQSDETKKRKKFVSTMVFLLGSIILIGGVTVAVLLNLPETDPAVAKNDNQKNAKEKVDDQKKVVDIKNNDQEASPLEGVGNPQAGDIENNQLDQQPFNGGVEPRVAGPKNANRAAANQEGVQRLDFNVGEGDGPQIPMDNFPPGALEAPVDNVPGDTPKAGDVEGNPNQPVAEGPNAIGDRNNPQAALPPPGIPPNDKGNPAPEQFPKPKIPGGLSPLEVPPLPDIGSNAAALPFRGGKQPANLNIEPEPPKKKVGLGSLEKIDGKIGDLAGLLERNGTSLTELRDVADGLSADAPAGIPKYVVEKPDEIKPNLEKLKLVVGGMLYDKAPLPRICRDLTAMTGIPITIDAAAIANAGKNPNELVSIKIEDSDLDTALNKILVPMGLAHQNDELGLTITSPTSRELATKNIPLPASLKSLGDQARKKILSHIQNMVQPEIWVQQPSPSTIKIEDDNIVVTCPTNCHPKIQRLIDKLAASIALSKNGADQAAIATTQTRSESILAKLEKEIIVRHSIQMEIGSYLNKLQKKTGVSVVVDWKNVIVEGWNPKTKIPGNIDEKTVQEVIRQLALAMNLTVVAVNEDTLILTTTKQASTTTDIEVYPVGKLLGGKFTPDTLYETFETTLGSTLRTSRYVFDPDCLCFIVAAPQTKQRQVAALLKRLEGI